MLSHIFHLLNRWRHLIFFFHGRRRSLLRRILLALNWRESVDFFQSYFLGLNHYVVILRQCFRRTATKVNLASCRRNGSIINLSHLSLIGILLVRGRKGPGIPRVWSHRAEMSLVFVRIMWHLEINTADHHASVDLRIHEHVVPGSVHRYGFVI